MGRCCLYVYIIWFVFEVWGGTGGICKTAVELFFSGAKSSGTFRAPMPVCMRSVDGFWFGYSMRIALKLAHLVQFAYVLARHAV